MCASQKIRILIADDHRLVREGFSSLLSDSALFEVVGQAQNGKELLEMIKVQPPDIVISDIRMPLLDGYGVLNFLKKEMPLVRVIILSMYYSDSLVSRFILEGASAFLPKTCSAKDLFSTLENVHKYGYYFNGTVSRKVLELSKEDSDSFLSESIGLTDRELAVLELVCAEKNNKEIGELLGITISTVEFHRRNIYSKSKTSNIVGLIKYAISKGVV